MVWTWAAASCRGTSHERAGTRLQDAHSCFAQRHPNSPFGAIVSDGAGSATFGGQGASLVCRALGLRIRAFFDQRAQSLPSDSDIEEWVDEARDLLSAVAQRRGLSTRDFAATLVGVISGSAETIIVHVGDGCAVLQEKESRRWIAPSWPDHGEYASTTFFLTDENSLRLRITRVCTDISAIAVFSDGIERLALDLGAVRPFERFLEAMMRPISASSVIGRDAELSAKLKTYLNSPAVNARTDDDKTLVLAARRQ